MKLTDELIAEVSEGTPPSSITNLALPNKNLQEIYGLKTLANLVRLDLSHNFLQSIQALSSCRSLKWLSVASNDLQSLTGIEALSNLLVLNGSCNKLTSIREVEGLVGLRALIVNDNKLKTICKLQKLTDLGTLVLSKNPIAGFGAALEGVPSLNKLSLSHCELQELGSIKQLIGLKELRLAHNNLKCLSKDLAKNTKLLIVDLGSNFLKKLSDIQVLSTLPYLRNLNVRGNPICEQAGYEEKVRTLLPALRVLDGHTLRDQSKKKSSNQQSVVSNAAKQPRDEVEGLHNVLDTGRDKKSHRVKNLQNTEKASEDKLAQASEVQDGQTSEEDGSHKIKKRRKVEKAFKDDSVKAAAHTSEGRQANLKKPKKRQHFEASTDKDISMGESKKDSSGAAPDDNESKPFIELIGQMKPADARETKERRSHAPKKDDSGLVSIIHQSKVAKHKKNKHISKTSSTFSIYVAEDIVGGGGQSSWD